MDVIAAEAGVSKLTVYSHFRDKETLFVAAIEARCSELLPDDLFPTQPRGPIRESLLRIARSFYALVSSEVSISLHRMILADQRNGPELGKMFWQAGPARITETFERFLRNAVASGQLDIPDPPTAARHFLCLLKGTVNMRMLCPGCIPEAAPEHADEHVRSVVEFFLRAYLPR